MTLRGPQCGSLVPPLPPSPLSPSRFPIVSYPRAIFSSEFHARANSSALWLFVWLCLFVNNHKMSFDIGRKIMKCARDLHFLKMFRLFVDTLRLVPWENFGFSNFLWFATFKRFWYLFTLFAALRALLAREKAAGTFPSANLGVRDFERARDLHLMQKQFRDFARQFVMKTVRFCVILDAALPQKSWDGKCEVLGSDWN